MNYEKELSLFSKNVGAYFNVIHTPFVQKISGVDFKFKHICTEEYGNFHVSICRLLSEEEAEKMLKKVSFKS